MYCCRCTFRTLRGESMTEDLYRASDAAFSADWADTGLRGDCRDAFLGALPRSGQQALNTLTPALRAALREACRIAYRAGYVTAVIETYQRHGATVDLDALVSNPEPEDKVVDIATRRGVKGRPVSETE